MSSPDRGERDAREPLLWIFAVLAVIVGVLAFVNRGDDEAQASFSVESGSAEATGTDAAMPNAVALPTPAAAPTATPTVIGVQVTISADAVEVAGVVPDQAIVNGLRSAAGSVFDPAIVTLTVEIDETAASEGATLVLSGEAVDAAQRAEIVEAFSSLGLPVDASSLILQGSDLSVAGAIAASPRLAQFSDFLIATGVDVSLNEERDEGLTVFAPTDRAMLALNQRLGGLPIGDELRSLLEFHIIDQTVSSTDLAGLTLLTTRQGETVGVAAADGQPVIGGALVVSADIVATNGIVHIVDAVLLPGTLDAEVRLNEIVASDPIQFAAGSASILETSLPTLDLVVEILMGTAQGQVEIAGHTDTQGPPRVNKQLSQERADAVRQYLIDAGIGSERLVAVGYGERTPLVEPEETEADRAANRRIEFSVT